MSEDIESTRLLLEILPLNSHVTKREFVPVALVARVYLGSDDQWGALLADGSYVGLKQPPAGERKADG